MIDDFLLFEVPIIIILYLVPIFFIGRQFYLRETSELQLSRWIVYFAPLLAWLISIVLRTTKNTGMGNFLFEPALLNIFPVIFFHTFRFFRGFTFKVFSKTSSDIVWLVLISFLTFIAGIQMPMIGDWL